MLSKSGSSKLRSFSETWTFSYPDLESRPGIKIDSKFVTFFLNFEYWKMNIKLIPHTSNYMYGYLMCVSIMLS